MTREEREAAISTLEYIKEYCHYEYEKETIDKVQEALEQEPTLDKIKGYIEHIRNTGMGKKKSLEFIEKFIEGLRSESEVSE